MARRIPWWSWHFMRSSAARNGTADGRRCIPHWDDPQSAEYERELRKKAAGWVQAVKDDWSRIDASLCGSWLQARQAVHRAGDQVRTCSNRLKDARQAYMDKYGADPDHVTQPRHVFYTVLMVLLFVGELPLNATSLRLLHVPDYVTYIVTLGLAISLLVGAHFLGTLIKEGDFRDYRKLGVTLLICLVAIVGLVCIAFLREQYIMQMAAEQSEALQKEKSITIAFVGLNIMVFVVAMLISYFSYDPVLDAVVKVRKQVEAATGFESASKSSLEKATNAREKAWQRHVAYKEAQQDSYHELIAVYRHANLKVRDVEAERKASTLPPAPFKPVSFTEAPHQLHIPPELEDLKWPQAESQPSEDASVAQLPTTARTEDGDR